MAQGFTEKGLSGSPRERFLIWDLLFLVLAAAYAFLAYEGDLELSGRGAIIDSDLQTYAQGMVGAASRENFALDPVLAAPTPANSIPNIERMLAQALSPAGEWAVGLLRAGAVAIFLFYAGWYILGRWLYRAPSLAAMLAIASGITVWIGWGTFWGATHSDPVPRVFFAALMPLLLLTGFMALRRAWLRPLAMLACGLAIWAHGVSALNCGAMLFVSYLLLPARDQTLRTHIINLALCLCAFFTPVLIFLWPSLVQGGSFSEDELAIFRELFNLRWHEDYGNFGARLRRFFSFSNQAWPILLGGLAGWIAILTKGSQREKILCKVAPCYLLALLATTLFCWLESAFAPALGRLPMGHELVRGLRFLVPVAWLLAIGGLGCLLGPGLRRVFLCALLVLAAILTTDRQHVAAEYAFTRYTGIRLPLSETAAIEARQAAGMRAVLEEIEKLVPANEAIYCPQDLMQARYVSGRALIHSFKDGYAHYYNRDLDRSAKWLELERIAGKSREGFVEAWLASDADWLLCAANADKASLRQHGNIVLEKNGWLLVRRK